VLLELFLAQLLSTPQAPPPPATTSGAVCPEGMRLVEGTHWENVQRLCTSWRVGHCYAFLPGLFALEPAATPVRVCMDELEWPNQKGAKPEVMVRFTEAEQRCASVGKRLCTEFEWELGCEGPATLPWPYGHTHEPHACNSDKDFLPYSEARLSDEDAAVRDAEVRRVWQGERSGSRPACTSAFGVQDLVGNVEEWVRTSRSAWRYRSSLKGGYWAKTWAGCRGTNDSHGPMFRYYEVGFRCCKDPDG
jgi:formylglycine-generating enzyme required for sulfatase activity